MAFLPLASSPLPSAQPTWTPRKQKVQLFSGKDPFLQFTYGLIQPYCIRGPFPLRLFYILQDLGNISQLLGLKGLDWLLPSYPVEVTALMTWCCLHAHQSDKAVWLCLIASHPTLLSSAFQESTVTLSLLHPGQASRCVPPECRWAGQQRLLGGDLVMWHATQLCDVRKQQR